MLADACVLTVLSRRCTFATEQWYPVGENPILQGYSAVTTGHPCYLVIRRGSPLPSQCNASLKNSGYPVHRAVLRRQRCPPSNRRLHRKAGCSPTVRLLHRKVGCHPTARSLGASPPSLMTTRPTMSRSLKAPSRRIRLKRLNHGNIK